VCFNTLALSADGFNHWQTNVAAKKPGYPGHPCGDVVSFAKNYLAVHLSWTM